MEITNDNMPNDDVENENGYDTKLSASTDLKEIYNYISKKYSQDKNTELYSSILKSLEYGRNKLAQNYFEQSLTINTDWIDAIQEGLVCMYKIIDKPKLSIIDERELVKLEKAKRVDAVAVRHLSTHTQFIKVVRDDGTVVPSQVMARELQEDRAIYENRFLYALLQRIKSFVGKRYNVLVKFAKVKNDTSLAYSSSFQYGNADIDCRFNIDVKTQKEVAGEEVSNEEVLARLEKLRQQIMVIEASPFMSLMKKAKPVYPPIQKTNIFTSNPEYSTCYNLWLILSSYDTVGYSVNILEKQLPFDNDYFEDLAKLVAASVQVMLVNNEVRDAVYAEVLPSRKTTKEFKVQKSTKFLTNVFESKKQAKTKDINDYYYNKIKSMIMDLTTLSDALVVSSEEGIPKKAMFRSIYKQIESINSNMYTDILNLEKEDDLLEEKDNKTENKLKVQKRIYDRYKQLAKLRLETATKAKKKEELENRKLQRLMARLKKEKENERKQKIKEKKEEKAKKKSNKE